MSPWVATTLPSITPTFTLQPVPQKRHGALSHLMVLSDDLVIKLEAALGTATPAATAVAAIAFALIKSRLVKVIVFSPDAEASQRHCDEILMMMK